MAYDHTCMHEFVMSLEKFHKESHVSALDVAKALLDYGIHPPTMYFPLIVDEALMVEPTESVMACPVTTPVRRLDEVSAARHPILKYTAE